MMRDYKFKRSEWTLRNKRRFGFGTVMRIVALLVAAGAGYALFTHFADKPDPSGTGTHLPANVIPLQLPPQRPQ
ncbi:hypothetical protein SAMN05421644_1442 [Allochromatium warmingii]|uniref:Uncharacterized protein n=1 Tax=Allochromatium warmingii TaxID=61595 RepID=A0A1H3IHA0_ALLWA|nr:hypothetical protein [Allochromatium warmingii]SDY27041.1 hypothetical protein SAMN05421644_1442 [Allochromatium warmingii]